MIKVTINPGQKTLIVPINSLALDVLKKTDIVLVTPCGGKGICGKCKIRVFPKILDLDDNQKELLTEEEIEKGVCLACQTYLTQDSTLFIPDDVEKNKAYFAAKNKVNSNYLTDDFQPSTQIKKVFIKLMPPDLQDQRSDWSRVKSELENNIKDNNFKYDIPISILAKIPVLLRDNNFQITLVLYENKIIAIEPGDTRKNIYGVAFDIGTTTIAGYLLNLSTFKTIATEASANPQHVYGDDVISRIDFSKQNVAGLQELQQKLIIELNRIIISLSKKAGIDYQQIYLASMVGNPSIQHFLWALPVENIAVSPYIPVITDSIYKEARDLPGFCLIPHAGVYTAPNVSAYIGGDTIADMIDISIWQKKDNILLVDLGTNGEIVLSVAGKIYTCSAAAGPAFEGARISHGMRADYGAIDSVKINIQEFEYHVIGENKIAGICGSGIIDLIAELLKLKIIKSNGRLIKQEECPANISYTIKDRILNDNKFLIASAAESVHGEPIYLTQKDIREIQLAKGAVSSGISILIKEAQIEVDNIDEIILTGA
ncbi:MAG: ASKHA domain-containing protein, partial [Atribacterota bacterium]|nr:ASKHA domain-containing protein [Atribacterota bacterium]